MADDSKSGGIHSDLAKFYRNLLPKPLSTVSFFDRGDFYSILGQDAVFVSKEILHRSSSELKETSSTSSPIEYLNVNKVQFEVVLKELLLVHLYRVEVYDCKSWKITSKASPGNISQFEDILFGSNVDTAQSFAVAALNISSVDNVLFVGLAVADQTSREFIISEFADNDRFSNLESAIIQLSPKECLVPAGEATPGIVRDILERINCLVSEKKRGEFSNKNVTQDLGRLLKLQSDFSVDALPEMQKQKALGCLGVLIKYLEFLSDESNFGKFKIQTFDLTQFVKLDAAAVKALNLMPGPADSKDQSLLGVLDKCKTSQGHRLLKQWIKQPLLDINRIVERHDLVEAFVNDTMLRQSVHEEHLPSLPDFQKLAKKLALRKATLQDCYRIYQALSKLPDLDNTLEEHSGQYANLIKKIFVSELREVMMDLQKFSGLVDEVLDMDTIDNLEFRIRPDFDEGLAEIGQRMKELEKSMEKQLKKAAIELSLEAGKSIKLENNSQLGYYLRLTRKDEKLLRNNKNYQILDTKKDGVRFTTRSLSKINDEYCELKKQYQGLQSSVVSEIMKVAGGYSEPLYILSDLIAFLDVVVSLATASTNATIPYVRPKMLPKGSRNTELTQVRHPCLEAMDIDFIPNDCVFQDKSAMFHIITGPNMGGKSTYIRSVAMSVLMAQVGCFVPCSSATITIVDNIMARIGAGDCQLKGVSTFMAEMLESSAILKAATDSSLIVIDELGRGTSTFDGFGLAWAISHHIATEIKCFTLFATHFHELTALAEDVPEVNNLHVSALTDDTRLTLLYKVVPGICDESFGLHVARLVKFPQRVLENAEKKSQELENTEASGNRDKDSPGPLTAEDKQKRKRDREESHEMLEKFVKKLKAAAGNDSDDAILSCVNEIRKEIADSGNTLIQSLIPSP